MHEVLKGLALPTDDASAAVVKRALTRSKIPASEYSSFLSRIGEEVIRGNVRAYVHMYEGKVCSRFSLSIKACRRAMSTGWRTLQGHTTDVSVVPESDIFDEGTERCGQGNHACRSDWPNSICTSS